MSEKLPIIIHRFYTKYDDDPKNPGTTRALDMVEYGPIGAAGRSHTVERIDILSKVNKNTGSNIAMGAAKVLWDFMKPRYEAWKTNQQLPETGTPLAAWNHLTPEQAEILRVNGVRSVEDVSALSDAHFHRIPIAGLRTITEAAKKYLAHSDINKISSEMAAKDETIAALTARVEQLAQMIADSQEEEAPKRRGRPPRQAEAAA
jgi:hypothetical protein